MEDNPLSTKELFLRGLPTDPIVPLRKGEPYANRQGGHSLGENETIALADNHNNYNQLAEAEPLYRDLLLKNPECHAAWHGLGVLAYKVAKPSLALIFINQALKIDQTVAHYHRNLSDIYRAAGLFEQAVLAGQNAVKLTPNDPHCHYLLALAYMAAGDKERALSSYLKTLEINPSHAMANTNLGNLYGEMGEIEKAKIAYEAAIEANPDLLPAYLNLASLKTFTLNDPHFEKLRQLDLSSANMPDNAAIQLKFALAKALDDCGQYDDSFKALTKGNDLYKKLRPYDEKGAIAYHQSIHKTFDKDFFARNSSDGCQSELPVFIVGMPRSGSTLIEQILASHPEVYGAGEINDLEMAMTGSGTGTGAINPGLMSREAFRRLGDNYVELLEQRSSNLPRIINKMLPNYRFIGLIHAILPNAKIIHAVRDPLDSCFSCYSKLFTEEANYTYDLEMLGRYYARYSDLMKYWKTVMPSTSVINVSYENIVTNTEQEARKLIDFIGLEWDPACLSFYQNRRAISTASVAQVRKPIYKHAVARWENYRDYLKPLRKVVDAYRGDFRE